MEHEDGGARSRVVTILELLEEPVHTVTPEPCLNDSDSAFWAASLTNA